MTTRKPLNSCADPNDGIYAQKVLERLEGNRNIDMIATRQREREFIAAKSKKRYFSHLSLQNVINVISEAETDGYQPHIIAPEQGYRRLRELTQLF